jgi:hypothetical protein
VPIYKYVGDLGVRTPGIFRVAILKHVGDLGIRIPTFEASMKGKL